ncbi:hypothetical protein ACF3OJ_06355 [Cardiobacterium hominis]|uniref:hypothetical protein n=1 Tax=Cardiobacterium hominis TaxID=2718 RepID=UPI00370D9640
MLQFAQCYSLYRNKTPHLASTKKRFSIFAGEIFAGEIANHTMIARCFYRDKRRFLPRLPLRRAVECGRFLLRVAL